MSSEFISERKDFHPTAVTILIYSLEEAQRLNPLCHRIRDGVLDEVSFNPSKPLWAIRDNTWIGFHTQSWSTIISIISGPCPGKIFGYLKGGHMLHNARKLAQEEAKRRTFDPPPAKGRLDLSKLDLDL